MVQTLKVYLIGAHGTGKTSFRNYHAHKCIPKAYISTMGIHIDAIMMTYNGKEYVLDLIDIDPSAQMFGDFDGKPYSQDQIDNSAYDNTYALAFYNPNKKSKEMTNTIVKQFKRKCNSVSVVGVWNKSDLQDIGNDESFLKQGNENYCKISLLNDENCSDPLFEILKMNQLLSFIDM